MANTLIKNHKKTYHHGDLKPALIQAGLEILEEKGLEALSLRAIASRVGVSHTAPKNHFDSFHGLLAAIAAEGFRRHAVEMRKDVEGASNERERLDAASKGYVRFARENPALFSLMFSPRFNEKSGDELTEAGRESYAVLEEISQGLDWPKRGPERGTDAENLRTQLMLWSFVHGYASLFNEGRMPTKQDGEPALDVLDVIPRFDYLD